MSKSRKRAAEESSPSPDAVVTKKSKKGKKNFDKDDSLNAELGVNTSFERMDNQLLADYLAQKLSRFGTDLSTIEISDLTISGKPLE